jgi:hypothetical protein
MNRTNGDELQERRCSFKLVIRLPLALLVLVTNWRWWSHAEWSINHSLWGTGLNRSKGSIIWALFDGHAHMTAIATLTAIALIFRNAAIDANTSITAAPTWALAITALLALAAALAARLGRKVFLILT